MSNYMEMIRRKQDMSSFDNKEIGALVLLIILTEKCNFACAHCMRGNATKKDISKDTLDEIFSKIKYIENLNLSGGEISLTPKLIRLVTESLMEHDTIVHEINFFTNGTHVSDEFLDEIEKLRDYVVSCEDRFSLYAEKSEQPLSIQFSLDDFHMAEMKKRGYSYDRVFRNIYKYIERFSIDAIDLHISNDIDIFEVGRAKTLDTPIKKSKPHTETIPYIESDNTIITGGAINISTDGNFIPINISYAEESEHSYGNIKHDPLSKIFGNMQTKKCHTISQFVKYKDEASQKFKLTEDEVQRYMNEKGDAKFAFFNEMLTKIMDEYTTPEDPLP